MNGTEWFSKPGATDSRICVRTKAICKGDGCRFGNCHLFAGIFGFSLEDNRLESFMEIASASTWRNWILSSFRKTGVRNLIVIQE